jgi:hypothetical protein
VLAATAAAADGGSQWRRWDERLGCSDLGESGEIAGWGRWDPDLSCVSAAMNDFFGSEPLLSDESLFPSHSYHISVSQPCTSDAFCKATSIVYAQITHQWLVSTKHVADFALVTRFVYESLKLVSPLCCFGIV